MASVLAWLTLLVGVPLLAYADWKLWRQVRRFRNPVFRVQAISVAVVLIHALVFGLIFVQNDMPHPPIDLGATKIITRAIETGGAIITGIGILWLIRRPHLPGWRGGRRDE